MSVSVELADLAERMKEFGEVAYLVTVNNDERPHVVSVRAEWEDGKLVVGAGRHTLANVRQRPEVTLLWPAPASSAYGLIVDGTAVTFSLESGPALAIGPNAAVLHRTPEGDPSGPSCITLLGSK